MYTINIKVRVALGYGSVWVWCRACSNWCITKKDENFTWKQERHYVLPEIRKMYRKDLLIFLPKFCETERVKPRRSLVIDIPMVIVGRIVTEIVGGLTRVDTPPPPHTKSSPRKKKKKKNPKLKSVLPEVPPSPSGSADSAGSDVLSWLPKTAENLGWMDHIFFDFFRGSHVYSLFSAPFLLRCWGNGVHEIVDVTHSIISELSH